MHKELATMIPPDSSNVLYFGCGDGDRVESIRQRNPNMQLYCVETNDALHEKAREKGLTVYANTTELLMKCKSCGHLFDAWVIEQSAWDDESLSKHYRQMLFRLLRPGASLVWAFGNNQYWEYLLRLITGKADGGKRFHLQSLLTELQGAGVTDNEIASVTSGDQSGYLRFLQLVQPLIASLTNSPAELQKYLQIDSFILRGRVGDTQDAPLHIAAVLGETQVCARVRIDEPNAFLSTLPRVTTRRYELGEEATLPENGRTVWIWQRLLIARERMLPMQKARIDKRILTVQEWDDDPLHWERHFRDTDFFSLRSAHAIQTSTLSLAEYLRQFNPEVKVFPNCIEKLPPLSRMPKHDTCVTIFYGALNRQADWKPILPVFNQLLQHHSEKVRVLVVWDKEFFDALQCKQKRFVPFSMYSRYMELLQESDIALLPMLPTRFNQMKSDLKYLECAAAGTVALASPTVYANTLQDGITGMLYDDEQQFLIRLQQLIEDAALRRHIVHNAWQWVKDNRMLSSHYRERLNWYQSLYERYDELTEAIWQRVPKMR